MSEALRTPQWWLAEIDTHGNPKLIDGSHSSEDGANRAAYLYRAMGLGASGARYAVAKVELSEVRENSEGVNHEAVAINRALVTRYKKGTQR